VQRLGLTPRSTSVLTAFVLGGAVLLRLDQYLAGRSLWLDESLLALNVIGRPIAELSEPLSLSQGAPFGFLVAAKLSVLSLGTSELALRLVPLLSGLAAVGLFYLLARRVLGTRSALLALALFACSHTLIFYSVEFKQYSTEVAATLALLLAAIPLGHLTARRYLAVSALGAVLLWFAYTTVFSMTAIAIAYAFAFALSRRWRDFGSAAAASLLWLSSGLAMYAVSYDDLDSVQGSVDDLAGNSVSAVLGQLVDTGTLIGFGAGFYRDTRARELIALVAFALCLTGAIVLLRTKPYVALMLGLPVVFMFAAVAIGRYPVFERTVLVAVPAVIIAIAAGASFVVRRIPAPAGAAVGVGLAVLVLAYPVRDAIDGIGEVRGHDQGTRQLVTELVERWKPGDTLYVHYAAQYAFRYYAECDCLDSAVGSPAPPLSFADRPTIGPNLWHPALLSRQPSLVIGGRHRPGDTDSYLRELDQLADRQRVWILSSHWESDWEQEYLETLLPRRLEREGTKLASFTQGAGQLLLYDLGG
jgi:dolichyl-phosphate-mannose-protein mannosyltransferase